MSLPIPKMYPHHGHLAQLKQFGLLSYCFLRNLVSGRVDVKSHMLNLIAFLFLLRITNAQTQSAPTPSPTTYPGNTVINVEADGSNWPTTLSSNITYSLPAGTFHSVNLPATLSNCQVFGAGMGVTTINANGNSTAFNGQIGNGMMNNVQVCNLDVNCGIGGSFWAGQGSNILLLNCHSYGYASNILGQEHFNIYAFASGNVLESNFVVNGCRFTPSSTGNVDGTTVVALGAYRSDGSDYSGNLVTNCIFDTPTDHGTGYYHCIGLQTDVTNCTFTAPNFAYGGFTYNEPGSWNGQSVFQDDSSHTLNISGNHVTLAAGYPFVAIGTHPNGRSESFNITGNTISNGVVFGFQYVSGYPANPTTPSVVIQHNATTNTSMTNLGGAPSGSLGTLITSPNP